MQALDPPQRAAASCIGTAATLPDPPAAQNNEADDVGENLEFDFSDETEPELGTGTRR